MVRLIRFYVLHNPATIERIGQQYAIPAGWEWVDQIVGYVWFVLLSLMVVGRWLVIRSGHPDARYHGWLIVGYVAFCFSYVFTFGLTPETGLVGNVVTAILAVWVGSSIHKSSTFAAVPILASAVWVSIAAVYLFKLIQIN